MLKFITSIIISICSQKSVSNAILNRHPAEERLRFYYFTRMISSIFTFIIAFAFGLMLGASTHGKENHYGFIFMVALITACIFTLFTYLSCSVKIYRLEKEEGLDESEGRSVL